MLLSFLYLVVRRLLRLLIPGDEIVRSAEVEVLILRHELKVLRRGGRRPAYRRRDRVLLAACSRLLPRASWRTFIVTPQTLVRWHRELVRRKRSYRRRGVPGREGCKNSDWAHDQALWQSPLAPSFRPSIGTLGVRSQTLPPG